MSDALLDRSEAGADHLARDDGAAAAAAEEARAAARAEAREAREAEGEADGSGDADAAAEERRKRREKRRGLAWDKDAHGNTIVAPMQTVLAGVSPLAAAFGLSAPGQMLTPQLPQSSLIQQQAGLTRRARRLHVGSLPPGVAVPVLRELFNDSLFRAGLTIGGAREVVNDVQMDPGGKFAFLEFRSVREATSALALDGLVVLGRALRVQRPNDFAVPPVELHDVLIPQGTVPAAVPAFGALASVPGISPLAAAYGVGMGMATTPAVAPQSVAMMLSGLAANPLGAQNASQISRKARRLHIGNLPQGMGITPQMMQQFFNATLIATGLIDTTKPGEPVIDCTINPGGKFAFVEFRTIAEATSALTLNNVELAGRQLRVERPRDYTPVPPAALAEIDRAGYVGETPICNLAQVMEHSISGGVPVPLGLAHHAPVPGAPSPPALPPLAVPPPPPPPAAAPLVLDPSRRVLGLSSMVTELELADAAECADILDDARTECAKHGEVEGILLLRTPLPASLEPGVAALAAQSEKLIFVRFAHPAAASAAAKTLHGKKFDGRTVAASFHADAEFDSLSALPHHTAASAH